MPVPTFARRERQPSPPESSSSTPAPRNKPVRPPYPRAASPTSTNTVTPYTPTVTGTGQHKVNVVARVAIEGKAKHGEEGAAVKMYLKIALPLDSVAPGSTVPLFPEENVKILSCQVHPLDSSSVPYNFSSALSPALHNAARALNLPARSSETYSSLFGHSPPIAQSVASSSRSSRTTSSATVNSDTLAPVDAKYTGHILVSGYHVSYVTPKEYPPRSRPNGSPSETETDGYSRSHTPYKSRRASIGERNVVQFMAAIDMWVPYVSRPPRSPYLLSIPTPRCLHNNIKLRIFPPTTTSSSFASLSSIEEDGTTWDLAADPHVTRTLSKRSTSRTSSYGNFADDESSDSSSTGFADGCGIQGSFPSAERIRVRWAKPIKTVDVPGGDSGRRRVGVREVKGEMTCVVIGKARDRERSVDGVVMDVEYKGTCRGVWFPGVATLLGMDVGLEAKGSDVSWLPGVEAKWTVNGGAGYTGFDIGAPPRSRHSSTDSAQPVQASPARPALAPRQSSSASLLRAPLPAQNVADYSFENSLTGSSATSTMSSVGSLPGSSSTNLEQSQTDDVNSIRPPGSPVTLHINMNELVSPAKNNFVFTIAGTILVTPRPNATSYSFNGRSSSPLYAGSEGNDPGDPEPIVLPRFTVLAADSESTTIVVRNEVEHDTANVEVYNSSGDIRRDPQARKTVLQKGGYTRCGEDGGRIALRSLGRQNGRVDSPSNGRASQPPSRPRTPVAADVARLKRTSSAVTLRPKRDGPLMIPSVAATVTPLSLSGSRNGYPDAYAVRVSLPAPADTDSEWVEFGLAQPGDVRGGRPPRVEIASASVDGVPVRFECTVAHKQEQWEVDMGVPFEEMSGKEWLSWVRVHVGDRGGAQVHIDYIVREHEKDDRKGKRKAADEYSIFLPTFSLPVGRLVVDVDTISGLKIKDLRSNLTHQQSISTGHRLLHFSMEELFYPRLYLTLRPDPAYAGGTPFLPSISTMACVLAHATPIAPCLLLLCGIVNLGAELRSMRRSLDTCAAALGPDFLDPDAPETITVTNTVYTGTRWWFGEPSVVESQTAPTTAMGGAMPSASQPIPSAGAAPAVPAAHNLGSGYEYEAKQPRPASVPHTPDAPETVAAPTATDDAESKSLLPIHRFPFPWPLRFDFETEAAINTVIETLDRVWQMFRRIYHYPLDPT